MRERVALVVASAITLVVVGGAFLWLSARSTTDPAVEAGRIIDAYARAWESGAWDAMADLVAAPPDDFAARHEGVWEELEVVEATVSRGGVTVTRGRAETVAEVALTLDGLGRYAYDAELTVERADGAWRVVWEPTTLHPSLRHPTWRLDRREVVRERAPILARDGTPLTVAGTLHLIGIEPRRVEDPDEIVAAFEEHTDVDPDDVAELLARDDLVPDWFYPLLTVRPGPYDELRPLLFPVPGVVFRETEARTTELEGFAAHLLGRTGPVTAELLEELGEPYTAADEVGLSGLERAFERRLAGTASAEIVLVDSFDEERETVVEFEGQDPEPLRTTIDVAVQQGIEAALDGVDAQAAIVVLEAATGEILGSASRPVDGFNRAFSGLYPPGSTFKIVTAAAALGAGATPDDEVSCPAEIIVGGLRLTNAGDLDLGTTTLQEAFAQSCNTTFGPLGATLGSDLDAMAASFGFDVAYELPLDVAGGRFPEPRDDAERAAAAFGQARVQASPVHVATIAAAVASGTWNAPTLLLDQQASGARGLADGPIEALRGMMRAVVTDGTGRSAAVRGDEVAGKTGSAETGDGEGTVHAWFAGYRDDLAFAILVEGGGSGGEVAAPLARDLLTAIDEARAEVDG